MVKTICSNCGQSFGQKRNQKERNDKNFCSMECRKEYWDGETEGTKEKILEAIEQGCHELSEIGGYVDISSNYARELLNQMEAERIRVERSKDQFTASKYYLKEGVEG